MYSSPHDNIRIELIKVGLKVIFSKENLQ